MTSGWRPVISGQGTISGQAANGRRTSLEYRLQPALPIPDSRLTTPGFPVRLGISYSLVLLNNPDSELQTGCSNSRLETSLSGSRLKTLIAPKMANGRIPNEDKGAGIAVSRPTISALAAAGAVSSLEAL